MITAEEVVRSLPELLKQQPEFRTKIYEILSDEFVKRTEFYEYMTKSDERFERLLQELKAFREDTNRRFEAMDRRFEAMDRRFEAMRKDMNSRFEEVNKRFEAVDRRFEAVDRRFEEVDKRFEEVYRRFDKIDTKLENLQDWVGVVVGGFQRRAGRSLEDAIAGALRIGLGKEAKPENIVMRKKIIDDQGLMGPKGRSYEIDLCLSDTESMIFEIKSYAEEEDVERFNDKAELAMKKLALKKPIKALITLDKHPSVVKLCDKFGILVG